MNPNVVYLSYGRNPWGGTDQITKIVNLEAGPVTHQLQRGDTIQVSLRGSEKVVLICDKTGRSKELVPDEKNDLAYTLEDGRIIEISNTKLEKVDKFRRI